MESELIRFNTTDRFLFVDAETFNLNLNYRFNNAWQIGLLMFKGKDIIRERDFIINWRGEYEMSDGARKITGYTEEKVEQEGITPEEGLAILDKALNATNYLLFHNGLGFDQYIINAFYKKLGKEPFDFSKLKGIFDTLPIARGIALNIHPSPNEDLLTYQYKMLNKRSKGIKLTLGALGKQYGVDYDESGLHDAGNDLRLNKMIWDKMKYQMNF